MTLGGATRFRLWRVFPWEVGAAPGDPFSAEHVPAAQGSGRFDLGGRPPVLYLAESPAHALGEKLQRYRGQALGWPDLREFGRPLALVEAALTLGDAGALPDLCDPAILVRYGCRPDELTSRDIVRTQRISRRLYEHGVAGFRVWSSLMGDWHSTILFTDRLSVHARLGYERPEPLRLDTETLRDAARLLAISISAPYGGLRSVPASMVRARRRHAGALALERTGPEPALGGTSRMAA